MVSSDRNVCFEPCSVGFLTVLQLLFGLKIISVTNGRSGSCIVSSVCLCKIQACDYVG